MNRAKADIFHGLEHALFFLISILIAISLFLTVQPGIDIWIPLFQTLLSASLLIVSIWYISEKGSFNWSPSLVIIALLLTWSLISLTFTIHFVNTRRLVYLQFFYFVIFWASLQIAGTLHRLKLVKILIFMTLVVCLYGIHQKWIGFPLTLEAAQGMENSPVGIERIASGRIFSTFRHVNSFSGFLIMLIPITAYALYLSIRISEKIGYALALIGELLCLYYTQSMGAFLTLAVMIGLTAIFLFIKNRRRLSATKWATILITIIFHIGMALAAINKARPDAIWSLEKGSSLSWRWENWKIGLSIFKDHLLTGVGAGCYGSIYQKYMTVAANETQYAHNLPIQLSAELGVLGLLLISLLYGWRIYQIRQKVNESGWTTIFELSLFGYLIHNLVDFDFYFSSLSIPAFMLFGLSGAERRQEIAISPLKKKAILAGAIAVGFLTIISVFPPVYAEYQAEQALDRFIAGDESEAYMYQKKAVQTDPKNSLLSADLGNLTIRRDMPTPVKLGKSIALYEQAVRFDQCNPGYHLRLGQLYQAQGDTVLADRYFQSASDLSQKN
ncbi:MAG: hypothetical protein B6244_08280 [Candidatus Cloacimonetes bacterium 4572_55]|nr:MAG: hypothetical protein B6244_08280 [Candidatus Cloacimonetes bacterium 4572_55]